MNTSNKKTVVTMAGSSSRASINKQLVEYVGDQIANVELVKLDLNDFELPLFSIDRENEEGFSKILLKLNDILEQADAFVVSLAEHNGAYSAAFKNTFDWLSRINGKVWRDKPMLLLSAAPGARGGKSVLEIAMNRFPRNGGTIIGHLSFPLFHTNFSEGKIVDPTLDAAIEQLIKNLQKEL